MRKKETREEWRRRILEEAEELQRSYSGPPMEEVLEKARRLRESLPKNLEGPDSVELIRESRGPLEPLATDLAFGRRTYQNESVHEKDGPAMRKPMTATELRKDIYKVLDDVLETGTPQQVIRGSRTLMIVPAGGRRLRLADLPRREALNCTPDELVETTWEWEPEA
jgi:hypothetical protein